MNRLVTGVVVAVSLPVAVVLGLVTIAVLALAEWAFGELCDRRWPRRRLRPWNVEGVSSMRGGPRHW